MIKKGQNYLRRVTKGNALTRNIVIYSFGSLGSRAINIAVYPILTFFLLQEELGYYDLIVNTIFLVIPLATLQYADGIYRVILPLEDAQHKKKVIAPGVNFVLLASLVLLGLLLLLVELFLPVKYAFLVFLMAFLFGINQSLKQVIRGLKMNKIYVFSDILYSFVFIVVLLITLVGFRSGLVGVLNSFIIANLGSICFLAATSGIIRFMDFRQLPAKSEIMPVLQYSMPLIPNTLSWWLVGSANTYIITLLLGLQYNGIYAVAYKVSSVIYLLNKVFSLAWQDQLIGQSEEAEGYHSKIFNRLLIVLLGMTLGVVLLMKPLLRFAVEEAYFEVWRYIPFLMFAALFSSLSSYFGAFYLRWQTTRKIFISTLTGALIAVLASLVLTSTFGLMGTSVAMALGFGSVSWYRYRDTKHKLELKINPTIPILVLAIILAIILSYYL